MKVDIIGKEFSELFDDHLSHLGEQFRKAHTEGLDKMFDEPKHLSDGFIHGRTKDMEEELNKMEKDINEFKQKYWD